LHNPKYIHFGLIHQCDGWTDEWRQTCDGMYTVRC